MRTAIFKDDDKYLTDKPIDIDVVSPGQKLTINGLDYIVMESSISISDDPYDFPITQYLLVEEQLKKIDQEQWNKFSPSKEGFYWVLNENGQEHPAKYILPHDGTEGSWRYDHKRVKVIAFKYCPGSFCAEYLESMGLKRSNSPYKK